jgi:hypothetical protein
MAEKALLAQFPGVFSARDEEKLTSQILFEGHEVIFFEARQSLTLTEGRQAEGLVLLQDRGGNFFLELGE